MFDKQKLKEFIEFRTNVPFNTFKFIMDLEIKINQRISEMLDERMNKIAKGEKGEKGDRGPRGPRGISVRGLRGLSGLKGKTGLQGLKGNDGLDGKDGIIPRKGIDYFTKKEISKIIGKAMEIVNRPIEKINEEIKKIREDVISLKTTPLGGRKRTLHRGGASYAMSELLGTGDGETVVFTLANTPYDNDALPFLFVGGGVQFKSDDWTRSGREVTFNHAPPNGAKVRAPIYRNK